jgi:hypothetical protein
VKEIVVRPDEKTVDVDLWALPKMNQAPAGAFALEEPGSLELVAGVGFEPTTSGL